MDVIAGLEKVGFTHNESRAYAALIRRPGSTGYEVAKHSGIPRAKVYEVLESMVLRGTVLTEQEDDRVRYRPLPHHILLERHGRDVKETLGSLKEQLGALAVLGEEPPLATIRGETQALTRAREMCAAATSNLLICGLDPDLEAIAGDIQAARRGGRCVFVLQFGEADLGIEGVVLHHVSPLQHRQVQRFGRWLAVVRDMDEALLAQIRPELATALWTRHMGVVMALAMWIQHDIALAELARLEPELARQLNRRMQESPMLRSLWSLTAMPGPGEDVSQ